MLARLRLTAREHPSPEEIVASAAASLQDSGA